MPILNLSIFGGAGAQFFDNNGDPLAGGKIYTYAAGTTTPVVTYQDYAGAAEHTNPIILDAAGRVPSYEIWLLVSAYYKFVVKTSADVTVFTLDNMLSNGFGAQVLDNFVGDGSTVEFTLSASASNENNTMVYINGVYQQKDSYEVSGTTFTFSEAPPATSSIEIGYY